MNEIRGIDNIKIEDMIYEVRGKQVMLDSDLAKVSDVSYMFQNCSSLKNLNLSGAIFSNISTMTSTFASVPANCKIYIDCSQRDTFISKFGNREGLTTVNNEFCNA